jgi:phage terminase large subunit GpA-like protein
MPSLAPHPILAAALLAVRAKTLKPTPKLDLVQWADAFRYLSPEAASQPGRWATKAVEVARGPMLAVTEPGVHEITVMCCTQLMKTELLLNVIGYFTHQDPAPMLLLQPTVELAEAFSKDRIDPMFRDSPVLRDLLGDKRSRDANNTILHKSFPGGHLTMVGSNAPGNLAMRPVRVVLCDEVDKYPASAGNEGDPIKLAMERSATFWNWLVITTCSPTLAGVSRIEKNYERSDKRVFSVPCPHCGDAREMQWQHVLWTEGQPETAAYRCPECGCLWSEPERLRAIARGSWVATRPFNGHAGFAVSKLASPWESLSKLARKWED